MPHDSDTLGHLPLQVQCVKCGVGQERESGGQDCFVQLPTLPLAFLNDFQNLKHRLECMEACPHFLQTLPGLSLISSTEVLGAVL